MHTGRLQKKIFFLHIPKCGGTSIKQALQTVASPDRIHFLDAVESKTCAARLGVDLMNYRNSLLLYLMSLHHLNLIGGHFQWSDTAYEMFGDQWQYTTILRHPIDKWFSQYFYNRYKASNHFKFDLDLEEFIDSQEGRELGCDQVRKLSDPSTPPDQQLNQAIANLERFTLIGVTERMDRFRDNFKKCFDVRLLIAHANKNPAEDLKISSYADQRIRKKVEALCAPDMQLYNKALEYIDTNAR